MWISSDTKLHHEMWCQHFWEISYPRRPLIVSPSPDVSPLKSRSPREPKSPSKILPNALVTFEAKQITVLLFISVTWVPNRFDKRSWTWSVVFPTKFKSTFKILRRVPFNINGNGQSVWNRELNGWFWIQSNFNIATLSLSYRQMKQSRMMLEWYLIE